MGLERSQTALHGVAIELVIRQALAKRKVWVEKEELNYFFHDQIIKIENKLCKQEIVLYLEKLQMCCGVAGA